MYYETMINIIMCLKYSYFLCRPFIIYFRQPFYAKLSHNDGHVRYAMIRL